jgi:hypothetical protein
MIEETTKELKLPLPHEWNLLQEDIPRIRQALVMLDKLVATAGKIEEADVIPDSFTPGVMYSLPDNADYVPDTSLGIHSIVVSEVDVEDNQILDGQLVIVPAINALQH